MIGRLFVVVALAGSAIAAGAAPAGASCYPQKPQTCHTCRITGVYVGPDGVGFETECP